MALIRQHNLLYMLLVFLAACGVFSEEEVIILERQGQQECAEAFKARANKYLLVHFIATVDESSIAGEKGKVLQNSRQIKLPIVVNLADNKVIPGWIKGIEGACENSIVRFLVPPGLGYGSGLTVRFEVEILKVSDTQIPEPSMFEILDSDKDGQISLKEFEDHFVSERKSELDEDGKPPLALFVKDDVNQNAHLNWDEFSGPKGTEPPALAAAIIAKEKSDPELAKFKKGDPLRLDLKLGESTEDGSSDDSETVKLEL